MANQRRTHYEVVAELRKLAGSFLRQQIAPQLNGGGIRLQRITQKAQSLAGETRNYSLARLELLKSWEQHSRKTLPFLLELLEDK